MTIDELRRQVSTARFPVVLEVGQKKFRVGSRAELMIPSSGKHICVYHGGAFAVLDSGHIATLRREKWGRRQTT